MLVRSAPLDAGPLEQRRARRREASAVIRSRIQCDEPTSKDSPVDPRAMRRALDFGGGLGILAGQTVRNTESWYDPLIGVKGRTRFGESKFFATGWAVAGGFGAGSENFYDASVNIGYQWNKSIGTTIGYRVFDVEYAEGSFLYDVKQSGWGLGLARSF